MTYAAALEKLENLYRLIEAIDKRKHASDDESKLIRRQLYEAYGEAEDWIERFAGKSNIPVSLAGQNVLTYPNYIEAGYLSGSTTHAHQGRAQLLKIIGKVKALVANPLVAQPRDEITLGSLTGMLSRLRECCQYMQHPPRAEKDVQDIVWVMLRARFDRLEREETLPRFGVKNYKPDFGIPELRTLIEIKLIGEKSSTAAIQEELMADIPAYLHAQTQYDSVIFLVYDAAHKLRDSRKFQEDLRSIEGVVSVIVVPGIG